MSIIVGSALKNAIFDETRTYRYLLKRDIQPLSSAEKSIIFVLLNPSTADENKDDPTIRRCIRYATRWGYREVYIGNLSPYRATDPKDMMAHGVPAVDILDENVLRIKQVADRASKVVAGFGTHGLNAPGSRAVLDLLAQYDVYCFGKTKNGYPKHPLYLKKDIEEKDLERWSLCDVAFN